MAAKTIGIIDKSSGAVTNVPWEDTITLTSASALKLPFGPEELDSTAKVGNDLEITLTSGEKITIKNFFNDEDEGERNELVLEDENGVLWLGQYDDAFGSE